MELTRRAFGRGLAAAVVTAAIGGCTSPTEPIEIAPIIIDTVDVRVAESSPAQVFVRITGVIGDGCSSVVPPLIQRDGSSITIVINRTRPRDAICTQIAKLYDETLALGTFSPGSYTLRVNDVTRTFRVD